MRYNLIPTNDFINEIFDRYEDYLLKRYKINVLTLLNILYIIYIFDKNYKNLSFSSNLDMMNSNLNIDESYNIIKISDFINEDIFNININYQFDDYYINKYDYIEIDDIEIDDIEFKYNMGICLEDGCQNKSKPDEYFCIQYFHNQKYETDDYEIYEINLKKYYHEIIDKHLNSNIIYDIIIKNRLL